jgi:hypothetical protein
MLGDWDPMIIFIFNLCFFEKLFEKRRPLTLVKSYTNTSVCYGRVLLNCCRLEKMLFSFASSYYLLTYTSTCGNNKYVIM